MSYNSQQLNLSISAETDQLVFGKSDTSHTEKGFYVNTKGHKLFTRFWHPDNHIITPRAIAFISHGFSEHLGNYHTIGEELANDNILAFGHDHIGHGQSDGIAAYIEDVDDYVDDLVEHCKSVQKRYNPSLPLFLVAHSMGGMVALRASICYPKMFRGMVLVGPLIIPGASLGPIDFRVTSMRALPVRGILGLLSWFNPEMILGGVNMDLISRDEEVKRALASDGLRWSSGCKVRLLLAFVNCLEDNLNLMPGLKVPFLSLHGTEDGLCNVLGSRLLKECSFVDDKEVKEYQGSAHNLFMEIAEVRHSVVNKTVKWILDRS